MGWSKDQVAVAMDKLFESCRGLRQEGQKEYAHRDENAFANFERVAERLGISRERVLMVYAEKHLDGIHSYLKGHVSQRESVHWRIKDMIVYLGILDCMVLENEGTVENHPCSRCKHQYRYHKGHTCLGDIACNCAGYAGEES